MFMENGDRTALRVGIALPSSMSQAWVVSLLGRIQQSCYAHVSVVLLPPSNTSPSQRLFSRKGWSRALFRRYEQWDQSRNLSAKSALAPADAAAVLNGSRT